MIVKTIHFPESENILLAVVVHSLAFVPKSRGITETLKGNFIACFKRILLYLWISIMDRNTSVPITEIII